MKKISSFLLSLPKKLKTLDYKKLAAEIIFFSKFFILVIFYLVFYLLQIISRLPVIKNLVKNLKSPFKKIRDQLFKIFNDPAEGEISSLDLVILAVSHLRSKKSRTLITIGGMSIGFGAVLFLLSLGYGTQKLVISRVARLEEMRQINVTVGQASNLYLNDQTITEIAALEDVEAVLPLISAVAKVNYNNSIADIVAYGVSQQFLEASALQPIQGKLFTDDEIVTQTSESRPIGQVAGAKIELFPNAKMSKQIAQITYSVYPLVWKPVYAAPSQDAELLGYTQRLVGDQETVEVWGNSYQSSAELIAGIDAFGNSFSPWINDTFPLWKKEKCVQAKDLDCYEGEYQILKAGGSQLLKNGYITENDVTVKRYQIIAQNIPQLQEGETITNIEFSIIGDHKTQLYAEPKKGEFLLNLFTTNLADQPLYAGELVYGESYFDEQGWGNAGTNANEKKVGYWVKARLPQWRKIDCTDCQNLFLTETDHRQEQTYATAYLPANLVKILSMSQPPVFGSVLGETTDSSLATSSGSTTSDSSASATLDSVIIQNGLALYQNVLENGTIEWLTSASDSAGLLANNRAILGFAENAHKTAVVNRAMLAVLSLNENQAVGQTFQATIRLDEEFFAEAGYQAESEPTEITIVGVIPDEKTPAFYLPFSDIKNLGVNHYSQLKIITKNQDAVKGVRQAVEAMGYRTSSVIDTVGKINSLFATIKIFLSILGFIALGVAALGMFNTLTVSLLEKTREVGLMKVIGMKSNEVKRLFLAESIVMGLSGGIFGLILSIISGQILSLFISSLAITKGLGYIDLVYIPISLAIVIIILSFVIGVLTGLYPSQRATKISALNALRYE